MRKFILGFVSAFVLLGGSASATIQRPEGPPEAGVPFHPTGTVQVFLPAKCDVVREIHAEQHRARINGLMPEVREIVVFRLSCPDGRRSVVGRGPWFSAFTQEVFAR